MDNVTTSVEESIIHAEVQLYDVLGRSVSKDYRGIVIIGDKKYMLK